MSKNIIVRITKVGNRLKEFSITDNYGRVLAEAVTKAQLISGYPVTIEDNVTVITITSTNCCNKTINIPVGSMVIEEYTALTPELINTGNVWKHLINPELYNHFYGCVQPYIIEYPFSYQYNDEIAQSVQDYSKVYTYLPKVNGVFDDNRKIQTDNEYYNKAVLYNDQQSSGVLTLVAKPSNNLRAYLQYPIYNTDSKTILYTKTDNFYKFNTYWSIVSDKTVPLFTNSCTSMSIDKEVNQSNMNYTSRVFTKAPLRAKDLKVRLILDNSSSAHIVSQLFTNESQISYR